MNRPAAIACTSASLLSAAALLAGFLAWRGLVGWRGVPTLGEAMSPRFWLIYLDGAIGEWPHYLLTLGAWAFLAVILYRVFRRRTSAN